MFSSRAISPGCGVMIDVDAVASHQPLGIAGEGVQRVGVEHERHAGALEQRLDERRRAGRLPEPGPDRDDVGLEVEHAVDGAEVDRARRRSRRAARSCTPAPSPRRSARTTAASRSSPGRRPTAARRSPPGAPRRSARANPAMTSTRPKSPLCESAARDGTISRIRSRVSSSR